MEPPPTLKPTISTPPTSDATGQISQFLRVPYLVLTGLIDSALPAAGPWAVTGKALSYMVKLGPIIWWAMPVPASTPPSPDGALQYSWYPESNPVLEQLPATSQPALSTANQALAPPAQHPKCRIITAQIIQEIVALNLQGLSWDQIATQLQFTRVTIIREFNNLMNKGNLIRTAKKPKKAPKSQITKVYPIMLDLLQRDLWGSWSPVPKVCPGS
ncbi:hypothetical protein DSO57_1008882 [Entomophthora muscae]|uniref:Uncharacterized protein n=1 Tax=Entomophthora muscae TaxID=34485 RepID=A0ACC2RYA8_9FUNG|nr:hypothetical protein DSO57_1008882 [Entomophthora muscae]